MLVDMEHHSALMSLNMPPFNMSPSSSPVGSNNSNGAQNTVSGAASMTTTSTSPPGGGGGSNTNIPPPLYGSPPLSNYNSCQQQSAIQPLSHQPPNNNNKSNAINNLDSYYLFYSGGGSLSCMDMGGNSGYPVPGPQGPGGIEGGSSNDMSGMGEPPDSKYGMPPGQVQGIGDPPDTKYGLPPGGGHHTPGAGGGGMGDPPDTKYGFEELCPVCGDKVSGYHYGLLTCESCKGFFKRTVQNKKVYTCVAERSCHIDKTQRKRCPFCRFQKCLNVGMKLEAVRADRMRGGRNKFGPMYKRDRARKLQIMRQRQLAIQTIRGTLNDNGLPIGYPSPPGQSPFPNLHIKQEIQIPQVSSLTSSPDSSTSPIAVALGQVAAVTSGNSNSNPAAPALQIATGGSHAGTSSGNLSGSESKLWGNANSTTTSPHSLSPKGFPFDTTSSTGGSSGNNNSTGNVGSGAGGNGNSNSNSGSTNVGGSNPPSYKISPLIREFVNAVDDREWQNSLYSLLQNQTYNQCEVDLFELMCKVLDQNLFSQVDWARNSVFFKDLKVDDQMKLLQHSWSDMLVLDHMHHRMHNNLPDEMTLPNGQKFDLLCLGLLGVPSLADVFNDLTAKLQELKFDVADYICVKFLLLLNPEVRGISNRKHVQEGYEQIQVALHDYARTCYPQVQDKFMKLLRVLPDIHGMASRGEDHLYHKHCNGSAPTQTLLMEMLHAKRK